MLDLPYRVRWAACQQIRERYSGRLIVTVSSERETEAWPPDPACWFLVRPFGAEDALRALQAPVPPGPGARAPLVIRRRTADREALPRGAAAQAGAAAGASMAAQEPAPRLSTEESLWDVDTSSTPPLSPPSVLDPPRVEERPPMVAPLAIEPPAVLPVTRKPEVVTPPAARWPRPVEELPPVAGAPPVAEAPPVAPVGSEPEPVAEAGPLVEPTEVSPGTAAPADTVEPEEVVEPAAVVEPEPVEPEPVEPEPVEPEPVGPEPVGPEPVEPEVVEPEVVEPEVVEPEVVEPEVVEPAAAVESEDAAPSPPAIPVPVTPRASRPRRSRRTLAEVVGALILVVAAGFGGIAIGRSSVAHGRGDLSGAPPPAASSATAPSSTNPSTIRGQILASVAPCLSALDNSDAAISYLVGNIRDDRLSKSIQQYQVDRQACRERVR